MKEPFFLMGGLHCVHSVEDDDSIRSKINQFTCKKADFRLVPSKKGSLARSHIAGIVVRIGGIPVNIGVIGRMLIMEDVPRILPVFELEPMCHIVIFLIIAPIGSLSPVIQNLRRVEPAPGAKLLF
jgi:hypothetical protein